MPQNTDGIDDIDALSAVTHSYPYSYYAELGKRQGIFRDDKHGIWIASSAATVQEVFLHPLCRVRPPAEPVPQALLGSAAADIFKHLVRMNDGAGHCPFKQAVSATLQSLSIPQIEEQGRQWAQQLAAQHYSGSDDGWLDRYAFHMPVYVVASLLGVPAAALPQISLLMHDFVRCLAAGSSSAQLERGKSAAAELLAMFQPMLQAGGNRGLFFLLAQQAARLGCEDSAVIAANGIGFMSQAYEATAGLIANTLYMLANDADLRQRLEQDPQDPQAPALLHACIDEVLRTDPPVQNTRRFVAADGEIGGQAVRAGDTILLVLAAANRDPALNPQPQDFELQRSQRRHFSFGHGAHLCPGQQLAGRIAHAALSHLCRMKLDFQRLAQSRHFRPSANTRIRLYASFQ
ncbi:MAG: cytochrome P450 [Pseudomonadota bacterium]